MSFTSEEDPQHTWVKKLFLSERFSDCTICVKNSNSCTRFPGHRNILSPKCDAFNEALEKSSTEDDGHVVIMEDVNPDAVVKVLEYIYLGEVQLEDWKLAAEVSKVVRKYKIPKLLDFCENYVINNINFQNVCYILQAAISSNSKKVENECKRICQICGFVILNTRGFQKASLDIVENILLDPDLQIENELQRFRAAWKWATYKCCKGQNIVSDENVANEIQPLLHCIGFKSMSEEELKNIPETVMKKLSDVVPKSCSDKNISLTQIERKKSALFPPEVLRYFSAFTFDINHKEEECVQGNLDLMTFSVNASMYLINIKLTYALQVRFIMGYYLEIELYIRDRNKSLLFNCMNSDSDTHSFPATKILLLKAHEEYTLEVTPHYKFNDRIFLPLVSPVNKRLDGVEIAPLSKRCYGISEIAFSKAPWG